MLKLKVYGVLRLSSCVSSRKYPEFGQLISKLSVDVIRKIFQLCFDVVGPFKVFRFVIRQNIDFDEVLKPWEKPNLFKQLCPTSKLTTFLSFLVFQKFVDQ